MHGDQPLFLHPLSENSTMDLKDTALAKMLKDCVCLPLPVLCLPCSLLLCTEIFCIKCRLS